MGMRCVYQIKEGTAQVDALPQSPQIEVSPVPVPAHGSRTCTLALPLSAVRVHLCMYICTHVHPHV